MNKKIVCALLLASGAACGIAQAQTVINITGATLFENFFNKRASTNDYIDVDGDGCSRLVLCNDDLAPPGLPPNPATQQWAVTYRGVGSVRGFQELVDFGQIFVTTDSTGQLPSSAATTGWANRTQYILNSARTGPFNAGNPGGFPVRSDQTTLQATYSIPDTASAGGVRIDMAVLDVQALLAVRISGEPDVKDLPGTAGYGSNPRLSVNKDGTTASGQNTNLLSSLGNLNLYDGNPNHANANTVFDTGVAVVPIAVMTNLGTGLRQVATSQLRHLSTTGRLPSGENLLFVTRDSGSGTRNGFQNSICIDPSWGVGENVGAVNNNATFDNLGPDFLPSNKEGSGRMEGTVINHRLAVGYSGAERAVANTWGTGGRAEVLAVKNDMIGGTEFSRPTINDILDNNSNGYIIGGLETFCTIGDPRSAPTNLGGDAGNNNPDVRNLQASAYLNNITRSIAGFVANQESDTNLFTPAELLASGFILAGAVDTNYDPFNPCSRIANTSLNQSLQDFTRALPTQVYANPFYASFGTATLNGKAPTRKTGVVYTDNVANGANYITQGGGAISYASNLTSRNRIAYDFNGDAVRNVSDAVEMIKAWRDRNGGPHWNPLAGTGDIAGAPGNDAIIEVLGDGNGDGNFTAADIRLWADGLAMNPARAGNLDRLAGFTAVDDAFNGNFFGTTKATGAAYQHGDSAGDVANSTGRQTPGFAPIGADGVINAFDIDYVYKQFKQNARVADGHLNWSVLSEAINADLSADLTGDLMIDQADVCFLVTSILGTRFGDVDLDGDVDGADLATATTNLDTAGGWAKGDIDGDGTITQHDLDIISVALASGGNSACGICCPADYDGDGFITGVDFDSYVAAFESGGACADFDGDGFITGVDFDSFVGAFEAGCP